MTYRYRILRWHTCVLYMRVCVCVYCQKFKRIERCTFQPDKDEENVEKNKVSDRPATRGEGKRKFVEEAEKSRTDARPSSKGEGRKLALLIVKNKFFTNRCLTWFVQKQNSSKLYTNIVNKFNINFEVTIDFPAF